LLHLMRHGAPRLTGRFLGRTDCEPTAAGIAACVNQVADLQVEMLIASDLSRAKQAAAAIAALKTLPVDVDARWREMDFGDWDGHASNEIDGEDLARFWEDPDTNPPPRGERWSALVERIGLAIADLSPRPTLVVTHGGAMRAALAVLCGFSLPQLWAFDLPYASLISLKVWPGKQPSAQILALWP